MTKPDIIVIGGGVSGLTCAYALAQAKLRVQVWRAEPVVRTTSMVAAAFWYPYRAEPIERVGPWAATSYERFASMAADLTIGPAAGISMCEAIEVFPEPTPDPPWSRYVDMFRHALPEELPAGRRHGLVFEAPVVEMPRYLPWLDGQLARFGVEIIERRLDALEPALASADIVVNATGLGARELVPDPGMYPVRGQVVRVERVGARPRVIVDEHGPKGIAYIVPRRDDVVLGGVADEDIESLEEDPEQSAAIRERCVELEPALAGAKRLGVAVGVRPCHRRAVCLEQEERDAKLIVHDYGHGGAGVTLSWGCAEEVRDRVLAWSGQT